jgi:beta-glucosidase-like glycosyl hydrolase
MGARLRCDCHAHIASLTPCSSHGFASLHAMQSVLRDEWGWNGSVVSDGGAVTSMLNFKYLNLSMTDNITSAAAAALNAGCDMNSGGFEQKPNPENCTGCAPDMKGYAYVSSHPLAD